METLTEVYRSAYFTSLKQIIIDRAKAIIKTNSDLEQEYAELAAACDEFKHALGKEEVSANCWASSMESFAEKYGTSTDVVSELLKNLCDTDPAQFIP